MTDEELKDIISSAVGEQFAQFLKAFGSTQQSKYTLFEWLNKWLETEHKCNVSENVFKNDVYIIRKHVLSKGEYNKPLGDFKLMDLQSLVNSVESERQKVAVSNMLVAACRSAYMNELIPKDITRGYKKPKYDSDEDRALTRLEEKRMLRLLKGHILETYIKLVLYTGLRRNEALGLMRGDLDFDRDEIHVERQTDGKGEFRDVLKTKTSRRVVKMFPWLKKELIQFDYCKPDVRLFDFKPDYVTRAFGRFCKEANIPDFTVKSLRTTFATRCEEMGVPDIIIQAWLGHSSFQTTKKHYIKVNDEFIQAEYEKAVKKGSKTPAHKT